MMYDKEQQERLYIEYHPKVLGYIMSRVESRSDAEDLASAVFLKVYRSLPGFDDEKASLSTWIYTITRNTLIDHYRTRAMTAELVGIEAAPERADEGVLRREMLDTLAAALEKMDIRERDVIILHYYKRMTLTQIAAMMKISYSYVKVLHKKALSELKTFLR